MAFVGAGGEEEGPGGDAYGAFAVPVPVVAVVAGDGVHGPQVGFLADGAPHVVAGQVAYEAVVFGAKDQLDRWPGAQFGRGTAPDLAAGAGAGVQQGDGEPEPGRGDGGGQSGGPGADDREVAYTGIAGRIGRISRLRRRVRHGRFPPGW
ncbi:hypothetical protein GCM10010357_14550 [Streptomyces luteireticuli]|uniref:Uncharacterized protein n=1 Tax=Streptomyces luteireticuli TaxID=173858 RepID=A0ABN0YGI0_9ACTN